MRFTSGSGSEALMGHSEGKSMIYLETRYLMAIKGAGSQGVQNGSISCIALPAALPGGVNSRRISARLGNWWMCRKNGFCRFMKRCAPGGQALARFWLSPKKWRRNTTRAVARD